MTNQEDINEQMKAFKQSLYNSRGAPKHNNNAKKMTVKSKRINVRVTEEQKQLLKEKVKKGGFKNESEYVIHRTGI